MPELIRILSDPFTLLQVVLVVALARLWYQQRQIEPLGDEPQLRLARQQRQRTSATGWCLLLCIVMMISTTQAAGYVMQGSLEWRHPELEKLPPSAQAIVVLGGSLRPPDRRREHAELGPETIYRCLAAAELFQQGDALPIILCGGKPSEDADGPPIAIAMRQFMTDLGLTDARFYMEPKSHNTFENALNTSQMLQEMKFRHVVLVTDATHMPRAKRCFERQGIYVTPAPCNYGATSLSMEVSSFLPTANGALRVKRAVHEWLGFVWYRLRGRI